MHPWAPQGHSTIAVSLSWAVPYTWVRKEKEKKGKKEEGKKNAFKQTNQKQMTTKPCPLDSFVFYRNGQIGYGQVC